MVDLDTSKKYWYISITMTNYSAWSVIIPGKHRLEDVAGEVDRLLIEAWNPEEDLYAFTADQMLNDKLLPIVRLYRRHIVSEVAMEGAKRDIGFWVNGQTV